MNTTPQHQSHLILWIAALVILLTFLFLDAGALAWSASLISGHQLTAEILTFIVVLSGCAITVWRMKVS
jgi:hypothetical protein